MLTFRTLFVLAVTAAAALAAPSGTVRVIDGDTVEVAGERLRLFGIDAPELGQTCRSEQGVDWPCGAWVAETLRARIEGRPVACEALDTDAYGRTVSRCFVDGTDIGATLVAEGLAFAYARYSSDYLAAEAAAQAADAGLWSGAAQSPASFRLAGRIPDAPPSPACAIKGNISANGRVFHLPGSAWYDRTGIDTGAGERWFCSVEQALAAGWRAPRG